MALFLIITQTVQIFPGALFSLFSGSSRDPKTLPAGVTSDFITTEDGVRLEIWRLPSEPGVLKLPFVGLVFHGNGGSLENFFLMQLWFSNLGITSYAFDFRGFGKSSGWPSEEGINRDSDAFWQYVLRKEAISAKQAIVCGFSVGGAPAARIASIHSVHTLILVSAFIDLKTVIRSHRVFGLLAPFCFYRLPTIDYVGALEDTNLILGYGDDDNIVPPEHAVVLHGAYRGLGSVALLAAEDTGHNTAFFVLRESMGQALMKSIHGSDGR